jgi:hypothetical protein
MDPEELGKQMQDVGALRLFDRGYMVYYVRFSYKIHSKLMQGHDATVCIYLPTRADAADLLWTLQSFFKCYDMGYNGGEVDKNIYSQVVIYDNESFVSTHGRVQLNVEKFIYRAQQLQMFRCPRRENPNALFDYDDYTSTALKICNFQKRIKVKKWYGIKVQEVCWCTLLQEK